MTSEAAQTDVATLSFEDALQQLETIVRQLEQGNVPLERSIEMYERGAQLRKHCDGLLKAAEAKVEKIQMNQDGSAASTVPLDPESA
ncbi:exodeoxyribonuclease VII small subunit [Roseibium litorale]|uniref:Exodeoxyribonuclease 7 small subunit n=1 Tax=Roseibium litorale TaxID=2803841 RepID=A0ABR9CQH8_9HYPH|nr:exodeoxyribonuclease VII small subunit [Roseibium litorale]MBD8893116.1 exodeoxyribonuclease VII small subunit [Roseibium litorale]